MRNKDTPYLDFMEYRCVLVCQKLKYPAKNIERYNIISASAEQKEKIFGIDHATVPLFMEGNNNIRYELFHDIRTDKFIFAFHSTKALIDWKDNIQQLFGKESELYQQAKDVAAKIRPELRDKIIFTGHSLGGGLATVAALAIGAPAIGFNMPRIHQNTLADVGKDDSRIERFRVKMDIVSLKIPWTKQHVELGKEILLTTIPFMPFHSLGQVREGLKTELSFRVFLIDTITDILQPRVAVEPQQLRQWVFDIVQKEPLPMGTLPNLWEVDYRVESISPSSYQVIVSVLYRNGSDCGELVAAESDWQWDDLREEFREKFILTREEFLVYSIYKQGQQQ